MKAGSLGDLHESEGQPWSGWADGCGHQGCSIEHPLQALEPHVLWKTPGVIITDKLKSYAVAKRELLPNVEHRESRYLNSRAENSRRRPGGVKKTYSYPSRRSRLNASFWLTASSMDISTCAGTRCQQTNTAMHVPRSSRLESGDVRSDDSVFGVMIVR
jgi:hypothetical protein